MRRPLRIFREISRAFALGPPADVTRNQYVFRGRGQLCIAARHSRFMSAPGLGRVKTKSDLVVMSSGRQIFAFFCSPHARRAQNSGCDYTPQSFYTARVKSIQHSPSYVGFPPGSRHRSPWPMHLEFGKRSIESGGPIRRSVILLRIACYLARDRSTLDRGNRSAVRH